MTRVALVLLMACFAYSSDDVRTPLVGQHAIEVVPPVLGREGTISPPPQGELGDLRRMEVTQFTNVLLREYRLWYGVSNWSEMLGFLCYVVAPVLSGISGSTKDSNIATWAMGIGLVGVALSSFSHYAEKESRERGMAANQMLRQEGLPAVALLRNGSLESIGNNSARPAVR